VPCVFFKMTLGEGSAGVPYKIQWSLIMNTRPYSQNFCLTFALVGWLGLMAACSSDALLGMHRDSGTTGTGGTMGVGGSGSGGTQYDAAVGTGGTSGGTGGTLAEDAPISTGGVGGQTGGQISSGGATGAGGSTSKTCGGKTGITCATGRFCDLASNCGAIADATGTCTFTDDGCPAVYIPVCGCDGKTYPSDCDRTRSGVLKASDGACGGTGGTGGKTGVGGVTGSGGTSSTGGKTGDGGTIGTGGNTSKTCGGLLGVTCATGQFCDLASSCGTIADASGTCTLTGAGIGCPAVYIPVCGCNGKTYPSDCDRIVAGVLKASDGACPTQIDAGATACADAYLAWLAPGGIAGTGPAVVVCGTGWADTWTNVSSFSRETPPSSATGTYSLSSAQSSDLFARLAAVDFTSLPHATTSSVECYPTLYLRTCSTCAARTLSYNVPAQLVPEMEQVWLWFDQLMGASSAVNPRNYCNL
jgi:hypothetical protein